MKEITTIVSKDNPVLKAARALRQRKGREKTDAFLVEGRKLILEAQAAGFEIKRVFINAGALARGEAEAGQWGVESALEEGLFCELAHTVNPQPYIAVVGDAALGVPKGRDKTKGDGSCVLVLDRVADPGNVGTMLRTGLAAGMGEVLCIKGTADVFSDKVIRASAGAVFHLIINEDLSAAECISRVRETGAKLVVCDAGGGSLYDEDMTGPVAIVIGSEASGPQEEFLKAADAVVGIPMAEASESLNAGVAAAVVMYEAVRQCLSGGKQDARPATSLGFRGQGHENLWGNTGCSPMLARK